MSKYLVLSVVAVLICVATSAFAVSLYKNDFGTAAKQAEMTIVGPVAFGTAGYWCGWDLPAAYSYMDTDGDAAWQPAYISGYNPDGTTLTRRVYAPAGKLINSPSLDGTLSGNFDNWGTGGSLQLSYDGIHWGHTVSLDYSNDWGIGYTTTSTASDPLYQGLSSVWIRLTLADWGGNGSTNPGIWAKGGFLNLNGNLVTVPEPGSMLALGSGLVGLVGFAVRRRK